jgi:hypothetical protein
MPAPHAGAPTQWVDIPNLAGYRYWSTAVELGGGRVMVLGGSDRDREGDEPRLPTASTEIFDESDPAAGWRQGPPLAVERSHANSVLLPDGTVATVGGGYGEVGGEYYRWEYDPERHTHVELYDPRTGSVTLGPAQTEGRTYHSTALLLPDGRVMSAGDDVNGRPTQDNPTGTGTGTSDDTAEIYSPPYLFRGPRPRIAAAPAHVAHGARFEVRTPDGDVERAVLVAPGAVTHAVDTNQRVVELARPVRVPGEGYRLRAPSSRDVAPPGYYMLFLLDSKGVPSVAPFVRLGPGAPRPVLGALAVIPARFRAGARVSYTLSDPGKVRFTVVRAGSKRGAFTHRANRGLNRFTFTGRLRGRRLPPGRYRLRAVATDLAGNRSRRRSVRFSIAR